MNNIVGKKFYKVTVIGVSGKNKEHRLIYECLCECGNKTFAYKNQLEHGHKKSCGCIRSDSAKTHGKRFHPLYQTWINMKSRVEDKRNKDYKNYGGRGITICKRWLDINNFLDDMFPSYKKGLTLDRINTNGNYCKENCKWSTHIEQANNKRNNILVSYKGESKKLSEWAQITGIKHKTLDMRYRRGFSSNEIIEGRHK